MPYAVAAIGVTSFLAGLAVTGGRYVTASFLITLAASIGLWLRHYVLTSIDQAFNQGAGYGTSTRRRIRELPEVVTVPNGPLAKKRFISNG